ncbi:MAG: FdtA/QdtA family cupin domain-containing protein [Muribaculaceae bacterium]|nr:FdtA/QdtA family cupin domain-containing protein [Muribaculaceae bacterium]
MNKERPHIITFPKVFDPRGSLSFTEGGRHIPFDIARVYWIYDVPAGESRGSHSHKENQEVIVATGGSFTIHLSDGRRSESFTLNRPYQGLYVPPGYWRTLDNFSSGSVCMVLTSHPYDEDDYIRDYNEFIKSCENRSDDNDLSIP